MSHSTLSPAFDIVTQILGLYNDHGKTPSTLTHTWSVTVWSSPSRITGAGIRGSAVATVLTGSQAHCSKDNHKALFKGTLKDVLSPIISLCL
jgi:hypothetical protein